MKILIVRLSSLGDVILTQPIAAVLRKQYPDAKIDYLTKPAFAPLANAFGCLDEVLLWQNKKQLLKQIGAIRYDYIIDLQSKLNSWLVRLLGGARHTRVYQKQALTRRLIVRHLSRANIGSTLDLYATALKKVADTTNMPNPQLYPNPQSIASAKELLQKYDVPSYGKLIGVFPGAAHFTKQWPANYWADFINDIPAAWGTNFVLAGGWKDKHACTSILRKLKKPIADLSGATDTNTLTGLVSLFDGVLSGDSGPMHLAAALNKPQIAIFGATSTRLGFAPLNPKATILERPGLKCRPCTLHGQEKCPRGHFKCMQLITPAQLTASFKQLLEDKIWELA